MYQILRSDEFDKWLTKLRDAQGKARILARIRSAEMGNLGDVKSVSGRIREMRIHHGPGYRVYFMQKEQTLIVLLVGGQKSSQHRDIQRAQALASLFEEGEP
jgi:putative addiction module killer protein